jgi:hypothetical protein
MKLTAEEIRINIGTWMSQLFDNDYHPDDVKKLVEKLSMKIASYKMKSKDITKNIFLDLCKQVENEFNRQTKKNNS